MTLYSYSVFTDVYDLVKVEHDALRLSREGGVSGCLNLVPDTPATIGQRWL